jgi:tetratricopeptide (TPR) repeat protein
MVYYMMGRTEPARTALLQAANAQSDFPGKEEAGRRLALLGDGSGKVTDLSHEELETILQQRPDDIMTRVCLGERYESEGAIAKAKAAYEQALEVNPRLLSATVRLARLYAGPLANAEKAMELARKARRLAPDDPELAQILAEISYKRNQFAYALELLEESAASRASPDRCQRCTCRAQSEVSSSRSATNHAQS